MAKSTDDKLEKGFEAYSLKFTQKQMQSYLEQVFMEKGLPEVLEKMNTWSHQVGYLTPEKLTDNRLFEYLDKSTGVTFKTQINYARSNYTPKPLAGKNIPKLHCPICFENVGIPGKENLRVFSFDLREGRRFFIQQTPFPLFPYHFVLVDHEKRPMQMSLLSLKDLTRFIDLAPDYVACSNSDVEWAGASILQHHHYQVFKDLHLPIMEAQFCEKTYERTNACGYTLKWGLLNYPIATLKLLCRDRLTLVNLSHAIIQYWKKQKKGNTCNLIVRYHQKQWEAYFILRNPDFRTPQKLQTIKSEGVGIIEVAGEGIYPVPSGDKEAWAWDQIENHGLSVIKGIIEGANPVPQKDWPALFQSFKLAISGVVSHWG